VLDSNDAVGGGSPQRRWLDAELQRAREDAVPHLFAALHHGPFSSGYHGPNVRQIQEGLEDALREGGVELIFEGHDHLYERGDAAGLKYVVTGGGGAPLYALDRDQSYQLAFVPTHHFVGVEVEGERVTLEARLSNGTLLERCHFDGTGPFVCADGTARGPVRGEQTLLQFYLQRAWPWLLLVTLVLALGLAWRRRRRASLFATGCAHGPPGERSRGARCERLRRSTRGSLRPWNETSMDAAARAASSWR